MIKLLEEFVNILRGVRQDLDWTCSWERGYNSNQFLCALMSDESYSYSEAKELESSGICLVAIILRNLIDFDKK